MLRQEIKELIKDAIGQAQQEKMLSEFELPEISVQKSQDAKFGDYSTNVAIKIAGLVKMAPLDMAQIIIEGVQEITGTRKNIFEKIEAIKPGFINFFISTDYLRRKIVTILAEYENYGRIDIIKNQKVQIEFLDGNPTGPLTIANGRTGFYGDVLSNVMEKAGWQVEREYWVNNTGHQIEVLGHSILGDEKAAYRGQYIEELRKKIKTNGKTPLEIGEEAANIILEEMIKPTVEEKMKIKFDNWSLEKDLHIGGQIKKAIDFLKNKNLVYEKDGAVWFKSTEYGDDKDRVLITSDITEKSEEPTYFAADIAYHKTKIDRGYDKLINVWGADHHGYINRLRSAVKALGHSGTLDIIIMQLVKLFQAGKEVRMSKRTGIFVTVEELINEVGLDAARFFFLMYSSDKHLDFDLDLAKDRSQKNPVYYVQYAYARIQSILAKFKAQSSKFKTTDQNLELLNHEAELSLIKQIIRLPEIIQDTASDYQVQRLPQYALDLVRTFHKFYEECRVIDENNADLTSARLGLVEATRIVLKNTLDLMGISAPEKM